MSSTLGRASDRTCCSIQHSSQSWCSSVTGRHEAAGSVNQNVDPSPSTLVEPHVAPVGDDDLVRERESEARPAHARVRALDAEELLEDPALLPRRGCPARGRVTDTRTRPEAHSAATRTTPPAGRVLDRVGEQVRDDLGDPRPVAGRAHGRLDHGDSSSVWRCSGRGRSRPPPRSSVVDRERLERQHEAVLLDRLQVEEVVDQRREPLGLAVHGADDLVARRGLQAPRAQQLGVAQHATPAACAARARRSPSGRS